MNLSKKYQKIFSKIFFLFIIQAFFITSLFPKQISFADNQTIHNLDQSTLNIIQDININKIHSKNFLVLDRNSSRVLLEHNGYEKTAMASTTKIMTCILAIEYGNLSDKVIISKNATNINGSKLKLNSSSSSNITLEDLLYGLMLRSGNDAAIAIAEHISGSYDEFIKLMNLKAKELNLNNTSFSSPHGLDNENHFTTAYELALLTNYALENKTFKKIVSTNITSIYLNKVQTKIQNTNDLLRKDNNFYGVKTGFTFNAGRCLVSAYKKNNIDIIIVTLNANTNSQRSKDTIFIKDYIINNYTYINLHSDIYEAFQNFIITNKELYFKSIPYSKINLSDEFINSKSFIIKNNSKINFKINIIPILSYNKFVGEKIGTFNIYENDILLKSIDIILSSKIQKYDFKFYLNYLFKNIV